VDVWLARNGFADDDAALLTLAKGVQIYEQNIDQTLLFGAGDVPGGDSTFGRMWKGHSPCEHTRRELYRADF
jgi:hypothetical protein